MYTAQEVARITGRVFELVGFHYKGIVTATQGPGLCVSGDAERAEIVAEDKTALARGAFRLAQELSAGAKKVEIAEERRFASCGCFLDFSRNGVLTVEALKRYMDSIAALGMNALVMYTEDTFTVPEYPYLGYLRGRYTQEELCELDAYAEETGVELVPCIQTLGHLGQFLQWAPNEHLKDQPTVLMIDDPETYDFIEAEIRAVRACVKGRRLHIGMDEAHGVGLGRYFARHGLTDRFELLCRHLNRVVDICKKYDFEPIMWSDMFFRLGSKNDEYYDMDADIPQSVIDNLPDVELCYWDYYHKSERWYEHMLTLHERMGRKTAFAGGVWTWSGFLPHVQLTWATMEPGLKCCARHKVDTVLATLWGDDGAETNLFLALSQMPIFSETCWRGPEALTRELVAQTGEFLTGLPASAYEAMGMFYPDDTDDRVGKALVYCDLLYPLGPGKEALEACVERSRRASAALAPYLQRPDCAYADALFQLIARKAELLLEIRSRYLAGNRAWMLQAAREAVPGLLEDYDRLMRLHREQWEQTQKRNGWEVMALRYGAVTGRLRDAACAMERWATGSLETLCELDEEPLNPKRKYGMQFYNVYVSPVFSL